MASEVKGSGRNDTFGIERKKWENGDWNGKFDFSEQIWASDFLMDRSERESQWVKSQPHEFFTLKILSSFSLMHSTTQTSPTSLYRQFCLKPIDSKIFIKLRRHLSQIARCFGLVTPLGLSSGPVINSQTRLGNDLNALEVIYSDFGPYWPSALNRNE